MSRDWRDHTNAMTTAERARGLYFEPGPIDTGLITTFGHTCANAELERRRTAERERDEARTALESDRTAVIDGVNQLAKEIESRAWLATSRGPYEWDDDRYRDEFQSAAEAIKKALEPLRKIGADLSHRLQTTAEVIEARRNLRIERDEARAQRDGLLAALQNINEAIAAELERLAMDRAGGGECYMAKILYREFPDRLHESVGVVEGAALLKRASELRAVSAGEGCQG